MLLCSYYQLTIEYDLIAVVGSRDTEETTYENGLRTVLA